MDKKERQKLKKQLKKKLAKLINPTLTCRAQYHEDKQAWEVWLCNDYEIPAGLEVVKTTIDEDSKQESVISFMKEQEAELINLLNNHYNIENKPEKPEHFNFTVTFPPMFSTIFKDGVFRLKTQEEKDEILKKNPDFADNLKHDELIFEAGYYEFVGIKAIENDGFVLRKYAGLRAFYHLFLTEKIVANLQ